MEVGGLVTGAALVVTDFPLGRLALGEVAALGGKFCIAFASTVAAVTLVAVVVVVDTDGFDADADVVEDGDADNDGAADEDVGEAVAVDADGTD